MILSSVMRLSMLATLIWSLVAPAASLSAQASGGIAGRVLDHATELPVANAAVTLLTESGRTVRRTIANQSGRFLLPVGSSGRYRILAESVGYGDAVTAAVEVQSGDTLYVIVRLNMQAIRLPSLEVVGRSRTHVNPGLDNFHFRMARGMGGTFITSEQIEQRNPTRVSQLLPQAGAIVWGDGMREGGIVMGRTGCAPMIYIDGVQVTYPYVGVRGESPQLAALRAVDIVNPSSIMGIEVYRGAATLPAEFGGSTGRCGVIAIWTKRGR